jgi:dUTP pyrophosphatase
MEIPEGYWGGIYARSGLATKMGLRPANCTGIIDSDYRGEVIVALHNDTDEAQVINSGERIAQFVLMPQLLVNFEETDNLTDTKRGEGGFGSTGMN